MNRSGINFPLLVINSCCFNSISVPPVTPRRCSLDANNLTCEVTLTDLCLKLKAASPPPGYDAVSVWGGGEGGSVVTSSKNCQTRQLCSVCGDIKDLQAGFVMTRKQVSFRQRCTISSCVTGNQNLHLSCEDRQSPALLLATKNGYFTWEVVPQKRQTIRFS